jgi:hypothetical protein
MPTPLSSVASRRFMLGVLVALPTLPALFPATTAQAQTTPLVRIAFQEAEAYTTWARKA